MFSNQLIAKNFRNIKVKLTKKSVLAWPPQGSPNALPLLLIDIGILLIKSIQFSYQEHFMRKSKML